MADEDPLTQPELVQQLNQETGKISWQELQRHYARGVVIKVASEMDLVEVAAKMVSDDKETINSWLQCGVVAHTTDADALHWEQTRPWFWAVVTAPWVLVQEVTIQ
ncbi:MAG: DUF2288 domain-containing protein [Gammaproteobacteria bacterium]|nr:DUF2288 domain-containing protein [Gammaproteobacteria bacterium]MDH5802527.1 DUF2288 domain-containing protein [Gammaproteobacteria bacterium]